MTSPRCLETMDTVVVEDTQVMEDSQADQSEPVASQCEPLPSQPEALAPQPDALASPSEALPSQVEKPQEENDQSAEQKEALETDPEKIAEKLAMPATQAYVEGSQGPKPEAVAEESNALVRSNAFVDEEGTLVDDEPVLFCKKCNLELKLEDAVIRGPRELWCKECNALYSLLKRHQSWPPPSFTELSEEQQCSFFANCKKNKESKKGFFQYKTVRNQLLTTLREETLRQRRVQVGGTYLPISVYRNRGYHIDSDFESRNPRMWSAGLNEYVYLLCETTVDEQEVHKSVEAKVLEAERNIHKRKAVALTDEDDKKSTATSMPVDDMDLDTESGEEDEINSGGNKKMTPKQIEKKLKSEASKAEKDAKRDAKKEEAERKKKSKAVTKKVISMSSRLSVPLATALHKAGEVVTKAEAAGFGDDEDLNRFKEKMSKVEKYKNQTASALHFYSKNPACELKPLDFDSEKEVNDLLKDLNKCGQDIKKSFKSKK